jgi:predicted nucleotidyltransferase
VSELSFPTAEHARTAETVAEYARSLDGVDTVLVVNSCARGRAVPESDLDMAILMSHPIDEVAMERAWGIHAKLDDTVTGFVGRGPFSQIHLDFFDGEFEPEYWDDGGGPDDFEIEIGNRVAHAVPLDSAGPRFTALQERWLPYYEDPLRLARLEMVRAAALHDLDHVPFYLERSLHLQAFDRLFKAFREYLQALFISHRQYPLAYNKWLDEQLGWIGERESYDTLLGILAVEDFRGSAMASRAEALRMLVEVVDT